MLEDLFLHNETNVILATTQELPMDTDQWPLIIQQYILNSLPMLSNLPGSLQFKKIDEDKFYALGNYHIDFNDHKLDIPIVVLNKELQPLDLFIYDGEWYPTNDETINSLLTQDSLGSKVIPNKDISPIATGVNTGNMGLSGTSAGVSDINSRIVTASVRKDILEDIKNSDGVKAIIANNTKFATVLNNFLEATTKKAASNKIGDFVVTSVGEGNFYLKELTENGFKTANVNDKELIALLKDNNLPVYSTINSLVTNKIAYSWDNPKQENVKTAGSSGEAIFDSNSGVVPLSAEGGLLYIDGTAPTTKIAFSGETYFIQDNFIKTASSRKAPLTFTKLSELNEGDLFTIKVEDHYLEPLTYSHKLAGVDGNYYIAENYLGKKAGFLERQDIRETQVLKKASENPYPVKYQNWYIGTNPVVFKLNKRATAIKTASAAASYASLHAGKELFSPITIKRISPTNYIYKKANKTTQLRSAPEVALMLKHDGCNNISSILSDLRTTKQAHTFVENKEVAEKPKRDFNKIAKAQKIIKTNRVAFLKVAASLDDSDQINSVLNLNYLTEENLGEFIQNIPNYRKVEESLCRLLLSTRLGNNWVEESDVKTALTSLHKVLKMLQWHA